MQITATIRDTIAIASVFLPKSQIENKNSNKLQFTVRLLPAGHASRNIDSGYQSILPFTNPLEHFICTAEMILYTN